MKIINFKPMNKGALVAFFDVVFEKMGMTISCSLFEKDGKKWVNLPQREYEKDGKKCYQSLVKLDEGAYNRFKTAVVELIDKGEYEGLPVKEKAVESVYSDDCPF